MHWTMGGVCQQMSVISSYSPPSPGPGPDLDPGNHLIAAHNSAAQCPDPYKFARSHILNSSKLCLLPWPNTITILAR